MAGYRGNSMSWNAVEAYARHEMPMSKWKKSAILEEVRRQLDERGLELQFDFGLLDEVSLPVLRRELLFYVACHHTGCKFRLTAFYAVNVNLVTWWTEQEVRALSSRKHRKAS